MSASGRFSTRAWRAALALIALLAIPPLNAGAQQKPHPDSAQGPVFTILEENDLVVRTDRHYTQGIKFSYLQADNDLFRPVKKFSDWLPALGYQKAADKFGYVFGQSIFTPADEKATDLIPDDRPYAGWLYGGLALQRRGLISEHWLTLESLELQLGVIGPESLAQQAQSWVHQLRGFDLFQGWRNQLQTEPGLALRYQRAARFSPQGPHPHHFDFIPHVGFSLGNVETSLRAGAQVRLGFNLPSDFGVQTISSLMSPEGGWQTQTRHPRWGAYLFAGAEGWLVGYTAFLDGNLFRDSHSVPREPWVAELKTGVVLVLKAVELGLTYAYRTQEFKGQNLDAGYGSLFIKTRF